jgi:prepilin-type N-terminal cleavage/methylation domain-containing protein
MIKRTPKKTRRRGGFTLIEILVVVAIIGILLGLLAVALFPWIGTQSKRTTEILLQKVHTAVEQQAREVIIKAREETPKPNVLAMAGGDPERARIIWIKLRLKQEFPMSYAEALNPTAGSQFLAPSDLPPLKEYVTRLQGVTPVDPNTQMAACLLMSLQRPRKGQKFSAEETLGAHAIKDTDGDGVPEIVDGWGKPVLFFRWGTGNPDLDASYTSARGLLDRDTEDPAHKLMDASWNPVHPGAAEFQNLCHWITQDGQGKTPRSYFTQPVIVSLGPDRSAGLDITMKPISPDANDNIYSFKVKH